MKFIKARSYEPLEPVKERDGFRVGETVEVIAGPYRLYDDERFVKIVDINDTSHPFDIEVTYTSGDKHELIAKTGWLRKI